MSQVVLVFVVFCVAMVGGVEFVPVGLRRRRFWAWVVALCIFGLYVPSLFLPLGALGLWGLLDPGSRAEFGIGLRSLTAIVEIARNSLPTSIATSP